MTSSNLLSRVAPRAQGVEMKLVKKAVGASGFQWVRTRAEGGWGDHGEREFEKTRLFPHSVRASNARFKLVFFPLYLLAILFNLTV